MPQRDGRSERNPLSISQVSMLTHDRNQLLTGNFNDRLTDCITDDREDVMVPRGTGYVTVTDMFELTSVQQTG